MFCPKCKKEYPEGNQFCENCEGQTGTAILLQDQFSILKKKFFKQLFLIVLAVIVTISIVSWEDLFFELSFNMTVHKYMYFGGTLLAGVLILIISFLNWRCPRCRRYLGKNFSDKFCKRCGIEFRT